MYTSGKMPGQGPGRPPRPASPQTDDQSVPDDPPLIAPKPVIPAGGRPMLPTGAGAKPFIPAKPRSPASDGAAAPPVVPRKPAPSPAPKPNTGAPAAPLKPASANPAVVPRATPAPAPAAKKGPPAIPDRSSSVPAAAPAARQPPPPPSRNSGSTTPAAPPAPARSAPAPAVPTASLSKQPNLPPPVHRKTPFADTDLRNAASAGKRAVKAAHLDEDLRKKGEEELDTTFRATQAKGAVDDMVLLTSMQNEAIVNNLKERYYADKIYTYIGPVLISVNPFKKMYDVGPDVIHKYMGRPAHDVPPHVYAVADRMYRHLVDDQYSQCVIISGESGAGKTEASKLIMNHWVLCSGGGGEVDRIKNIILESNPLLEAFGNAKTLRNNNSSRFGKLFEIQFDRSGRPVGGLITNFLLEKSRVVSQLVGERSFHIFYQVLAGATPEEKEYYGLYEPDNFLYLAGSECFTVDNMDDAKDFQATRHAMEVVGIDYNAQQDLLRIIAAILNLGNVTFEEVETGGCQPSDASYVEFAASLLGVHVEDLTQKLTSRTMTTGGAGMRGSVYEVPFSPLQAVAARDALSKSLYSRMFDYLIEAVNAAMGSSPSSLSLNVLDIYGFEIFDRNGFEQFCINYVNEKLQQIFIELTLQSEQDDYTSEGIQWTPIKFFNNKIVCDVIESRRPPGVLAVLDDVCKTMHQEGDGVDEKFLQKAQMAISNPHFMPRGNRFVIKHYAGDVDYEVEGFVNKNKDILFKDLIQVMQSSDQPFVFKLFENDSVEDDSRKAPTTYGFKIYNQAQSLVKKLKQCEPSYIRCIKPNETKKAHDWDEKRVLHQTQYLGLLENVRVRRAGFAYRGEYQRFIDRYNMCHVDTRHWSKDPRQGAQLLMTRLKIPESEWRMGKTKMFIKGPEILFGLDDLRDRTLNHYAAQIQRFYWRHDPEKRRIQEEKIYWWDMMVYTFQDVKQDGDFGKNIAWPEYQDHLSEAVNWTWQIYRNWRAYKMVTSLIPHDQEAMRQKVVSYDIFHGKKAWPVPREYVGNYLSSEKYYQGAAQYRDAEKALLQKQGESVVIFSDIVGKVNKHGKTDNRALMVTDNTVFKYDYKKLKMIKKPIKLSAVSGVSMSPHADSFIVVHMEAPERDLLINLNVDHNNKVAEFVTMLYQSYLVRNGKPLPVNFVTQVTCNLGRSAKSEGTSMNLSWEVDPKPVPNTSRFAFTKKPNGVIYYTP